MLRLLLCARWHVNRCSRCSGERWSTAQRYATAAEEQRQKREVSTTRAHKLAKRAPREPLSTWEKNTSERNCQASLPTAVLAVERSSAEATEERIRWRLASCKHGACDEQSSQTTKSHSKRCKSFLRLCLWKLVARQPAGWPPRPRQAEQLS